jgi:hypothetical protein
MGTVLVLILVIAIYWYYRLRRPGQQSVEHSLGADAQYQRYVDYQNEGIKKLATLRRESKQNKIHAKELEERLKDSLETTRSVKEMCVRMLTKFSGDQEMIRRVVADWAHYAQILDEIRSESELADRYSEAGLDPLGDEGIDTVYERARLQRAQLDEIEKKFRLSLGH